MANGTTVPSRIELDPEQRIHRLLVLHAPRASDVGTSRTLGRAAIEIGRGPSSEGALVLLDPEVSRVHARVELATGSHPEIQDCGSRNGTFVDGIRVERAALVDGSILRIGAHVLLHQVLPLRALSSSRTTSSRFVGRSLAIRDLMSELERIGPTDAPVLVRGETGVGKELVARDVHQRSGRPGELVAVNCAALPEALAESELFGHARGAFTGASARSVGLFGAADRGSVFLDEIGDMPLALQPKLLRVLESGEIRAVGETQSRRVDVRVIAATHVDLEAAIGAGRFRADLYARLSGMTVTLPPLRSRRDDVLLLLAVGLGQEELELAERLSADAAEALLLHPWPFNVREVMQLAKQLATLQRERLELSDLPEPIRRTLDSRAPASAPSGLPPVPELTLRPEGTPTADELRTAARHFRGNVSHLAEFFGKERKQIYRWAERLGVNLEAYRQTSDR